MTNCQIEKNEDRSPIYRAKNYCIVIDKLFRRPLVEPLLQCMGSEEARTAILEVHTGICGDQLGARNLTLKVIRQGIFWSSMRKDYEEFFKTCKSCQFYSQVSHRPTMEMILVLNPCPFFQWGIDIVGHLPKTKGQAQYIVVAVDYASKWIEAKPLAKIHEK